MSFEKRNNKYDLRLTKTELDIDLTVIPMSLKSKKNKNNAMQHFNNRTLSYAGNCSDFLPIVILLKLSWFSH